MSSKIRLIFKFFLSFLLYQFFLGLALAIPYISIQLLISSSIAPEFNQYTMLFILILYMLYSLFYAYYVGYPLYQVAYNIEQLAIGRYDEAKVKHKRNNLTSKRLYEQVNANLNYLSDTLKSNELKRKEFEIERQEWAAGVTHDLKTPLSLISGYTEMLLSNQYQWNENEKYEFIKQINEKSLYMQELIEDLRLAFRMDEISAYQISSDRVDIVELVKRVTAEVLNMPISTNYLIDVSTNEKRIYVTGDQKLLHRAVSNLLVNAIAHNPEGTQIELVVSKGDMAQIKIKDNGIGMDEEVISRIFDRYYRGTSTGTLSGGTGLGMAIVNQIVKGHGGRVEVKSQLGQGTQITLILPTLRENII